MVVTEQCSNAAIEMKFRGIKTKKLRCSALGCRWIVSPVQPLNDIKRARHYRLNLSSKNIYGNDRHALDLPLIN